MICWQSVSLHAHLSESWSSALASELQLLFVSLRSMQGPAGDCSDTTEHELPSREEWFNRVQDPADEAPSPGPGRTGPCRIDAAQRTKIVPLLHLGRLVAGAAIGWQRPDGAVWELDDQNLEGLQLLNGRPEPPLCLIPHLDLIGKLLLQLVQLWPKPTLKSEFNRRRAQFVCQPIVIKEDEECVREKVT
jgi:hypothetical protein